MSNRCAASILRAEGELTHVVRRTTWVHDDDDDDDDMVLYIQNQTSIFQEIMGHVKVMKCCFNVGALCVSVSSGGTRRIRMWLWELWGDRAFGRGPEAQKHQLGKKQPSSHVSGVAVLG